MDDHEIIEQYLDNAFAFKARSNLFAHGLWIGRALSHAEQNAVDPDWLIEAMEERGLDAALVAVPKIQVGRG